jgi:predicted transcriptional regulator
MNRIVSVVMREDVLTRLDLLADQLRLSRSATLNATLDACLPLDAGFSVVRDGDVLRVLPQLEGAA